MGLSEDLKKEILNWPELGQIIDQRAEEKVRILRLDKRLTPDEMADAYGVSRSTIDRLTAQELSRLGWEKIYIASLPRFQRIADVEASREMFKRVKRSMK